MQEDVLLSQVCALRSLHEYFKGELLTEKDSLSVFPYHLCLCLFQCSRMGLCFCHSRCLFLSLQSFSMSLSLFVESLSLSLSLYLQSFSLSFSLALQSFSLSLFLFFLLSLSLSLQSFFLYLYLHLKDTLQGFVYK